MNVEVLCIGGFGYTIKYGEKTPEKRKGYQSFMDALKEDGFILSPEIREGMVTDKKGNVYFWDSEVSEALRDKGLAYLKSYVTVWEYCDERIPSHKKLLDRFKKIKNKNNKK